MKWVFKYLCSSLCFVFLTRSLWRKGQWRSFVKSSALMQVDNWITIFHGKRIIIIKKFAIIFILKVNILNANRLLNGNRSILAILRRLFNYFSNIPYNKEWKFSLNLKMEIFVFVCFSIIIFIIDPIISICKSMDNNMNEEDLRVFIPFIFQAIRFF